MKDTHLEDIELYDSTSVSEDDDEDDYVPDSTTDPEDSDASLDVTPRKRLNILLNLSSDMPNECDSTTLGLDINPVVSKLSVEDDHCSYLTVEEQPCSSQDTNDSLVVSAHQNKNLRQETVLIYIAESHLPKWEDIWNMHTKIKWIWQDLLAFQKAQERGKNY
ncbi:N-lysine methyltransferase KMT5A [Scomber scombrus]|uniref:N-lysine methyltransferase KMT5A n=1 Tax=Scomber scombrus TaxID=13677 RepID=A0AAV1PP58_SCOSC